MKGYNFKIGQKVIYDKKHIGTVVDIIARRHGIAVDFGEKIEGGRNNRFATHSLDGILPKPTGRFLYDDGKEGYFDELWKVQPLEKPKPFTDEEMENIFV